jgi:hypothetical protein
VLVLKEILRLDSLTGMKGVKSVITEVLHDSSHLTSGECCVAETSVNFPSNVSGVFNNIEVFVKYTNTPNKKT